MLISIILPVYNVSAYIERSLCSALNQTYPFIEIILVNDGSTDDTMNIVNQILHTHPRSAAVKVISHDKNRGPSAGRNTGLKYASGKYVFFLDNDDSIPADCIETLATAAHSFDPHCIVGDYTVSHPDLFRKITLKMKEGLYTDPNAIMEHYLQRDIYIMVWNKLYRRDFILENNLFFKEGLLHEDELWSFQLFSILPSLYIVCKPTYLYEIRQNSIMGTLSDKTIEHRMTVTKEMVEWIKQHPALQNNSDLFYFFEDWKNKLFRTLLRFKTINHYSSYILLRELIFTSGGRYILKAGRFKNRLRTIHYLFKPSIGFRIQRMLLK